MGLIGLYVDCNRLGDRVIDSILLQGLFLSNASVDCEIDGLETG